MVFMILSLVSCYFTFIALFLILLPLTKLLFLKELKWNELNVLSLRYCAIRTYLSWFLRCIKDKLQYPSQNLITAQAYNTFLNNIFYLIHTFSLCINCRPVCLQIKNPSLFLLYLLVMGNNSISLELVGVSLAKNSGF